MSSIAPWICLWRTRIWGRVYEGIVDEELDGLAEKICAEEMRWVRSISGRGEAILEGMAAGVADET